MMRVRLKKLKEVDDPTHPRNIEEGFETIKGIKFEMFKEPEIGERFWVGLSFSTSAVQEILSENTFRTLNSVYEWEIIKN